MNTERRSPPEPTSSSSPEVRRPLTPTTREAAFIGTALGVSALIAAGLLYVSAKPEPETSDKQITAGLPHTTTTPHSHIRPCGPTPPLLPTQQPTGMPEFLDQRTYTKTYHAIANAPNFRQAVKEMNNTTEGHYGVKIQLADKALQSTLAGVRFEPPRKSAEEDISNTAYLFTRLARFPLNALPATGLKTIALYPGNVYLGKDGVGGLAMPDINTILLAADQPLAFAHEVGHFIDAKTCPTRFDPEYTNLNPKTFAYNAELGRSKKLPPEYAHIVEDKYSLTNAEENKANDFAVVLDRGLACGSPIIQSKKRLVLARVHQILPAFAQHLLRGQLPCLASSF